MSQRLTKIVCTLGPSSHTREHITKLADAGMNVARINLSHASREEHQKLVETIREVNKTRSTPISILLDTRGSEIRTGKRQEPIMIKRDEEVLFYPHNMEEPKTDLTTVEVNYEEFARDVKDAHSILIDNGELSFDLVHINSDGTVVARAQEDGNIGDRRHVNLPGGGSEDPSLTERDWDDIAFAANQDVDYLALSFIRSSSEVQQARGALQEQGKHVRIITKIETNQSLQDIANIVAFSDGIMIARGDLGAEVPYETLPAIQDEIVSRCMDEGKPVIIATHMLESMREHPIPTRAEMTDVSHAATTMADATMLSGETASGKHPTKVVQAMDKLLTSAEKYMFTFKNGDNIPVKDEYDARAQSVVSLAHTMNIPAILVFTRSGLTAMQVSKFRPGIPIIACTEDESVQRALQLYYGVIPIHTQFSNNAEETIQRGLELVGQTPFAAPMQRLLVLSDVPKDKAEWSIQLREVPIAK